ncbi:EAL domain-containing protein [Azonexus sp. IMCC34842]|uniref:bifunctional diguanylate cyclase/phosphodiesterase n=1 Tax=Azonexus sp. IMCC34842 TaxID=3420950 RepID=UPI003D1216FF
MNLSIFQNWSLKTRATLFTLAIFLGGLWTLALYASQMLHNDMQRLLGEQQVSTVTFIAAEINRELGDRLSALKATAKIISPTVLSGPTTIQDFLEQRPVLQNQFNGGIAVLDRTGTAIADVPRTAGRIGVNYQDVESVATVLREGKAMIARPVMGKKLRAPIFTMLVPILDAEGGVVGVLSGITNLSTPNFLDQITENHYGRSGYYLLQEPSARLIITGSGKAHIMQSLPPPGVNALVDRHLAGDDETAVTVDPFGTEILASARRIPIANWLVVAALPTAEAFAPIRAMQQRMIGATILLTVLAGLLTWWMLRRQLAPMLATIKTLASLAEKDQPLRPLPIARQDEVGQLIGGFNRLLETVRQREEALIDSEARFRNFFEKNSSAMLIIDPATGSIKEANKAAAAYYGYSSAQLTGMPISNINTLPAASIAEDRQRAMKEERNYFQFRHRLASGEIRDVEVHATPMEMGGHTLLFSIIHDITERKQAEDDLRIAAVAFESQQSMIVTDANRVILRVNRAFIENTGYSTEEVLGQTPRLLHSGRQDKDFYRAMWETIGRTGGWQGEVWDRRKNGEIFPKWLTITAVKRDDGVVTHYIGTHHDITERKQAEEKIEALAFFDQLTGLPNRTLLLDRLKQAQRSSARSGNYCALLFLDLDNFKTLNDTLGHEVGDLLLKQVAQRLLSCVREGDSVARLGGDEFVVILSGLSGNEREAVNGTETVAEKILTALNQIYLLGDVGHHSTASIGATLFNGARTPIDELMKQSDLSMYKAKSAGRNTFRFFDPAMEIAAKERAALEGDLRRALAEGQFLLHYQAQMADDDRLTGAEVLVRWQHPRRGMVSPADFIPLAEESGLILPLGQWVLETACRQLATWARRADMAHLTLAVNVSAHQLHQADFVEQVLGVLDESGANPQHLKLELTESLLVDNVEAIIEKMSALKAKGVGFSLDDFGTGYSSLSYLKRLPLDQLKIDQSFVRDVLIDPNDAAIAKTVVALAQSLGLGVIAEGVETKAQRDFLANAGCHAYQGYFFSRPLPLADFEKFVEQR